MIRDKENFFEDLSILENDDLDFEFDEDDYEDYEFDDLDFDLDEDYEDF